MSFLLDVNVLLALAWPNHVHHGPARTWFADAHKKGWATCSVTESGFIRVSSNARVTPDARTPTEAALLLHRMCSFDGHEFLADSICLADKYEVLGTFARSSADVTDAHLALLARESGTTFVTFDRQASAMSESIDCSSLLLEL